MCAFLQNVKEKAEAATRHIWIFLRADRTKRVARGVLLGLASLGVLWTGWQSTLLAGGLREGVAPQFLPHTLPLLFSGVLYLDRFAGVFGVILSAILLLTFLEGSRSAFKKGLFAGIFVLGVIASSTPLTLVAWLVATTVFCVKHVAQSERRGFVVSMMAIVLSVLLLSGGAFLADMAIVSTVSSQLPAASIFLSLILLFGGALWSIRSLEGAYVLIPIYITLRLCLFFLGSAPALLLTVVAVIAALAAMYTARSTAAYAPARASVYLLFMAVPLTMIAVEMQVIDAVQCFLFGGLAVATAGILGGIPTVWPTRVRMGAHMLSRFVRSVLPGTFMGTGALLLFAGFISLAQFTGPVEIVYLAFLALLTFCTFLFLTRSLFAHEIRVAPWNLSGVVQAIVLLGGGIFFAQILAYLGTTIGGNAPDSKIAIVFGATTLSFTPWILFVASAVLVAACMLVKKYQVALWDRVVLLTRRLFTHLDRWSVYPKYVSSFFAHGVRGRSWLDASAMSLEQRAAHMTLKERGVLMVALFIVTIIVLF